MQELENIIGQLAMSMAGRDKGRFYLICEVIDESFVRVIDGEKRSVKNPKKKNIKHIKLFPQRAEIIGDKLLRGDKVTDWEVAETIKSLGLSHKNM